MRSRVRPGSAMSLVRRVALVAMLAGTGSGAVCAQELLDRVLAVASGDVITLSDVRTSLELGRVETGGAPDPVRVALSQLIDRALVLDEVERFAPPEPTSAEVDAAFAGAVARFASPAAFDAVLARNGVDRPYVRALLREDLRIRAYLDQRFTAENVESQRRLVNEWVSGLRQRAQVIDQYTSSAASAPARGTAGSGRD